MCVCVCVCVCVLRFLKFIYLCLFLAALGSWLLLEDRSLVVASRGCSGVAVLWLLLLWSTGSVVIAHGLSCSAACRIFPDQGLNLYLLHWQEDFFFFFFFFFLPLSHPESPIVLCLFIFFPHFLQTSVTFQGLCHSYFWLYHPPSL